MLKSRQCYHKAWQSGTGTGGLFRRTTTVLFCKLRQKNSCRLRRVLSRWERDQLIAIDEAGAWGGQNLGASCRATARRLIFFFPKIRGS
jgi:hypothetical protein